MERSYAHQKWERKPIIENYLGILEESLKKKVLVLDEIEDYTTNQESLLKQEKVSMEELDANMEQKDGLIQKLTALDDGFETLYERVKEQLKVFSYFCLKKSICKT